LCLREPKVVVPPEVNELLKKIYDGKVVLFIGAGASVDAGGPTTESLVEQIKKTFPKAKYTSDDFIQTCTDAIETTLTPRADLERVIVRALLGIKPSTFHLQLPLHPWPAIFTTNYDDLIERGYREVEDRVQIPDPVFSDRDVLTLHDREKVKIFKLMGCIVSQHPDNKLVLTRADYNSSLRSRPGLYRTLADIMMEGTILYIGYSFQDNLLIDILNDLQQTIMERLSYSYALLPEIKAQSIEEIKLRERKIIPLHMTATQLAGILKTGTQPRLTPIKEREGVKIIVKHQHKTISHRDFRLYSQAFDLLTEDRLVEIQPDNLEIRRDFFRGLLGDWTGYVREWDFKRSQYNGMFDRSKKELQTDDIGSNKSLLICGPAGSGKTTALHRMALSVYRELGNPVIFLRPYYSEIDLKLLTSLCEELSSLEKTKKGRGEAPRARVLIIMESASSHVADFKIIPIFMKSRGVPILLLGSSRENEWEIACQRIDERLIGENTFILSDKFESEDERIRFARHLNKLDIVEGGLSDTEIARLIEMDYQDSFFAAVYSLIEPARPVLDDKIVNEYQNLSALAQRAYLFVASFYQYALPMPLVLLVRALNCSYDEFIREIYQSEAKRIICDIEAPLEGVYLGTRHRIIAERLIEKQMSDIGELVSIMAHILSSINTRNFDEVQICRTLLVRYIGPNGIEKRFSPGQIRSLFKAAVEQGQFKDTAVLHHFGLFESDNQNQDLAEQLVKEALGSMESTQPLVFLRTERVENLYNTMGLIYSRKAQKAEDSGEVEVAENLYSAATDCFSKAKGGELQTPHPYDSECRMLFYRANERTDDIRLKISSYARALDVIDEAEDNLPDESLPRLLELRAKIQDAINEIHNVAEVIDEMEAKPGFEASAALARAKFTLLDPQGARQARERALQIVKQVIQSNKSDAAILRTYSRLYRALYPEDKKELYRILSMRYEIPKERRNLTLLYELGVLSFSFTDYIKSLNYFRDLERVSQGHPKRWGIHDIGTDEAGKELEFRGTVARVESPRMAFVDVPQLRRLVPFLPYAQKFEPLVGENVTFKIGFNYRGWLAIDLSR
jgi:hypothetical protein